MSRGGTVRNVWQDAEVGGTKRFIEGVRKDVKLVCVRREDAQDAQDAQERVRWRQMIG